MKFQWRWLEESGQWLENGDGTRLVLASGMPLLQKNSVLLFLPPVASGSFVHDVDLKTPAWTPAKEELMVLSAAMHKLAEKNLPFERLVSLQ